MKSSALSLSRSHSPTVAPTLSSPKVQIASKEAPRGDGALAAADPADMAGGATSLADGSLSDPTDAAMEDGDADPKPNRPTRW